MVFCESVFLVLVWFGFWFLGYGYAVLLSACYFTVHLWPALHQICIHIAAKFGGRVRV